jgi:hypothetical protein
MWILLCKIKRLVFIHSERYLVNHLRKWICIAHSSIWKRVHSNTWCVNLPSRVLCLTTTERTLISWNLRRKSLVRVRGSLSRHCDLRRKSPIRVCSVRTTTERTLIRPFRQRFQCLGRLTEQTRIGLFRRRSAYCRDIGISAERAL